jgi:hypothetical protein
MRHLQFPLQQPWQLLLLPLLPVSPQPALWPEPSQLPCLSQQRVTPGTQMVSHLHVYLYVVTFFIVQYTWHTRTSLQPQCGQQSQHDSHPAAPQHVALSAIAAVGACPKRGTLHSKAMPVIRKKYFVIAMFSYGNLWIIEWGR